MPDVLVVTILACIWEISLLTVEWDANNPEIFVVYFSFSRQIVGYCHELVSHPFVSRQF
jgi:hypothetical protein